MRLGMMLNLAADSATAMGTHSSLGGAHRPVGEGIQGQEGQEWARRTRGEGQSPAGEQGRCQGSAAPGGQWSWETYQVTGQAVGQELTLEVRGSWQRYAGQQGSCGGMGLPRWSSELAGLCR